MTQRDHPFSWKTPPSNRHCADAIPEIGFRIPSDDDAVLDSGHSLYLPESRQLAAECHIVENVPLHLDEAAPPRELIIHMEVDLYVKCLAQKTTQSLRPFSLRLWAATSNEVLRGDGFSSSFSPPILRHHFPALTRKDENPRL